MKTILEGLKSYLKNNSYEQIEKDWAATVIYDNIGPRIDEFIQQSNFFYEAEACGSYWEYSCSNQKIKNPEFASDFFLL